jgi:hypothetical protein
LIVQLPRAVRPDEVDLSWSVSLEAVNEQLYEVSEAVRLAMEDVHEDVAVVDMAWSWDEGAPTSARSCAGKSGSYHVELAQLMYAVKLMGCGQ